MKRIKSLTGQKLSKNSGCFYQSIENSKAGHMKRLLLTTGLMLFMICLNSQTPVGMWTDHLSYNTAKSIAVTGGKVYASTGTSLLVYDKKYSELTKLSPVNGLSETGIGAIAWSQENDILIIAYLTANIDLIIKNTIYNLPDISVKSIPVDKTINRIRASGKYAFLCTSFGIAVIDLIRKEIHDTWRPGPDSDYNEVFDIALSNGKVYAATAHGIWQADETSQGLAYYGNWTLMNSLPEPDSKCTLLIPSGNKLYINVTQPSGNGDRVYKAGDATSLFSYSEGVINTSFDAAPDGFTITSPSSLKYYKSDGSPLKTISSFGLGVPDLSQGIIENDNIWVADRNQGLLMAGSTTDFIKLTLPGPASNFVANINSADGKTIICGGGTDNSWSSLGRDLQVSVSENNQFTNIVSDAFHDAMRSCFEPGNSSRFFVSSWGSGLTEYNGDVLARHYDETNSPLQAASSGNQGVRICGLAMDNSKNLWITQSGVSASIRILRPDGSWISYPSEIGAPVIGDILSTRAGQKWIILPGGYGLYIVDDNNTPDVFTDDKARILTIKDTDGNIIRSAFSIAEDLDGNIWVGTNAGPVIYYGNVNLFNDDPRGYRVKVPRNDGSGLADYMLGTETITSVSVDGSNKKWLGTLNSGVYQLSADGTILIKNYNRQNSPLFSNSISSVAVDNVTGDVWIGTSAGVLSVRETATSGGEKFGKVYSFPNPVRKTYTGKVTITGLMRDTRIKITDISGNLVYDTESEGGQASWDLTTYNGHRVTTGVYLVFCASSDGSQSCVTKILVIGN
jgi:hypothetical protein